MESLLPYVIMWFCLLPDTGECAHLSARQAGRLVLDLLTPEGWEAELTWWLVMLEGDLCVCTHSCVLIRVID